MKDNYYINKPTLFKLLKELDKEYLTLNPNELDEDLNYSICRIEETRERYKEKAKLVSIDELDVYRKKGWSIKEGFWIINDLAHYIAIKV
jgi:hypothetical protein